MSDLRQRLAEAIRAETRIDGGSYESIENNDYDLNGPATSVFGKVEEFAALALAVFAAWLRERAESMQSLRGDMTVAADMLDDWADEIAPKGEDQ